MGSYATISSAHNLRRLTSIIGAAIALAGVLLIAVIAYTGWISNASEVAAEHARVENALNRSIFRALDQQKSVAWWDDAVIRISKDNLDLDFADANFGIFLTETYGHQEVYILDGDNHPVYSFLNGARAEPSAFLNHEPVLRSVIKGVREGSSGGLRERPDDFRASQGNYDVLKGVLQWARWKGNILIVDGVPSIVAAMTIVPNVDMTLLHGTPYLLVSVISLDANLVSDLGRSLLLPDLELAPSISTREGIVSKPFAVDDGQFAGYITWTTSRPGQSLLTIILPLVIVGVIGTGILSATMLGRLGRASAELARREAAATYEAKHDALSGLPNRHFFALRTEEALRERSVPGKPPSIIVGYLDVDRFKDINDTLGHHTGDELIKRVAKRLKDYLAPDDFLARFGGDEFAVLRRISDGAVKPLERSIEAAFKRPFSVDGQDIRVTASLGLSRSPEHGLTTDALMQNADIALYEAKKRGRDQSVFFSDEMAGQLQQRRQIELELRESLHAGELELHYQPIISCETNRIVGVEALLRWFHPRNGSIPPAIFIPIAEEAGMMPELGEWVLRTAMDNAARWPELEIAINLSPAQFHHVDLEGLLKGLLESSAVDPGRITLEITEGLLLDRSNKTQSTLQAIRNLGFRIALDDFGTGFSSLRYLIDFRFDKLKIDRSFVSGMSRVGPAKTIVQTVIDLGRALGMDVVAEGVENEPEAVMMRALGCHSMQGYFFSKPVPKSAIEGLLEAFNGSAGNKGGVWANTRVAKKKAV